MPCLHTEEDITARASSGQRIPGSAKLAHREFPQIEFWRGIPAYADVDEATFCSHQWQSRNSITRPELLIRTIEPVVSSAFLQDVRAGLCTSPMSLRITPYLLSLINWQEPYSDPLRRQFIPVQSVLRADHPCLLLDPLNEQGDAPVAGLTHRYPDRALFLALDTCPVYCRFCTRSYAVGSDTSVVNKVNFHVNAQRWAEVFAYIESCTDLEDIVVSGGDVYMLKSSQISEIGERLLTIPHVRRIRFATKGLAVMPQKIISDMEWRDAIVRLVDRGRRLHKDVMLHTHFNHPREASYITQRAINALTERGVPLRNQSVLQRGVNDSVDVMATLVRRLSYLNVHPYYVYMHDLVSGVEDLRTPLSTALRLEKQIRGLTAGFNTPLFVVDVPGGGGKRDVHSFEHYDQTTGISVYTAPGVKPGQVFLNFDPLEDLAADVRQRWGDQTERSRMIEEAIIMARDAAREA